MCGCAPTSVNLPRHFLGHGIDDPKEEKRDRCLGYSLPSPKAPWESEDLKLMGNESVLSKGFYSNHTVQIIRKVECDINPEILMSNSLKDPCIITFGHRKPFIFSFIC